MKIVPFLKLRISFLIQGCQFIVQNDNLFSSSDGNPLLIFKTKVLVSSALVCTF